MDQNGYLILRSQGSYFVVCFQSCDETREMNTKLTFEWAHKQFFMRVYTLFYFSYDTTNPYNTMTSTVYWCIASKLKVPLIIFMEWIKRFCGWICNFSISLTLAVIPDIGGTTYHSRCRSPCCHGVWRPHHERWAFTSNFVQYISGFKWILVMISGQNTSHYTTAQLSVHVWNHDLIW